MTPRPLDGPAVWRGSELLEREDWLHTLTSREVEELDDALQGTRSEDPVETIEKESFPLPSFGRVLARIQDRLENGSGATMLRGLSLERYSEDEARRLFWGICRHIGTPVSQSARGERIFSVRDERHAEGDPRSRGPNTRRRLSFHTDRCDVIAFLCLWQAKSGGENYVVSSATLHNEILNRRPDLLGALFEPYYSQRHNVDTGNERPYCRQPVFSFREGHFAASYLRVLIDRAYDLPELPDMTPLQREAIDYLEELAEDPRLHVQFLQERGDILFLNNWVTLHRRAEFEDHADLALRRHLLRVWLAVPNSRPIDPLFAENFGSAEAGEVRGGMRAR